MGLCENCTRQFLSQGQTVEPLDGYEDHEVFQSDESESVTHDCDNPDWRKRSLVTESDGFDWVECKKCGIYGKRYGMTSQSIEVVGYER